MQLTNFIASLAVEPAEIKGSEEEQEVGCGARRLDVGNATTWAVYRLLGAELELCQLGDAATFTVS